MINNNWNNKRSVDNLLKLYICLTNEEAAVRLTSCEFALKEIQKRRMAGAKKQDEWIGRLANPEWNEDVEITATITLQITIIII